MCPIQSQVTPRADRMLFIRPCRYEMTESHDGEALLHEGCALSVNVSDQGMLLLLPQPAQAQQILEVVAPTPAGDPAAPHVVEVRWTKQVAASEEGSLCLAGVKVLAGPSRLRPAGPLS